MDKRDPVVAAVVRQMRDAIVDSDLHLVAALNRRIELVARLQAYRTGHGLTGEDPATAQWMLNYLRAANPGPLTDEALEEIYRNILERTSPPE